MLNALVDNRLSSKDDFQYGNVGISGHRFHTKADCRENRDLHCVGRIRDCHSLRWAVSQVLQRVCRPEGLVLCQDL